jgi:hypothetical protein
MEPIEILRHAKSTKKNSVSSLKCRPIGATACDSFGRQPADTYDELYCNSCLFAAISPVCDDYAALELIMAALDETE